MIDIKYLIHGLLIISIKRKYKYIHFIGEFTNCWIKMILVKKINNFYRKMIEYIKPQECSNCAQFIVKKQMRKYYFKKSNQHILVQ